MSSNTGAALERFEIIDGNAEYSYSPSEDYKLLLKIKQGLEFTENSHIAIWLENQSSYHIRTLYFTDSASAESLPFWSWKRSEYVKAKEEAEQVKKSVDAVTEATPNSSFKAEDYILSEDESYTVLIEINQPGDDQPSLIYAVDIDNSRPSFYQLLTRLGFPEKSSTDEKDEWHINYSTENFSTALKLIDSVMLIIQRKEKNQ
jgi:hypothetical protein